MTTKHDYCDHIDSIPNEVFYEMYHGVPPYHEDMPCMQQQIQDEAEMKEAYDSTLKRQGAIEALTELRAHLLHFGDLPGLHYADAAINQRISLFTLNAFVDSIGRKQEGGAA